MDDIGPPAVKKKYSALPGMIDILLTRLSRDVCPHSFQISLPKYTHLYNALATQHYCMYRLCSLTQESKEHTGLLHYLSFSDLKNWGFFMCIHCQTVLQCHL